MWTKEEGEEEVGGELKEDDGVGEDGEESGEGEELGLSLDQLVGDGEEGLEQLESRLAHHHQRHQAPARLVQWTNRRDAAVRPGQPARGRCEGRVEHRTHHHSRHHPTQRLSRLADSDSVLGLLPVVHTVREEELRQLCSQLCLVPLFQESDCRSAETKEVLRMSAEEVGQQAIQLVETKAPAAWRLLGDGCGPEAEEADDEAQEQRSGGAEEGAQLAVGKSVLDGVRDGLAAVEADEGLEDDRADPDGVHEPHEVERESFRPAAVGVAELLREVHLEADVDHHRCRYHRRHRHVQQDHANL